MENLEELLELSISAKSDGDFVMAESSILSTGLEKAGVLCRLPAGLRLACLWLGVELEFNGFLCFVVSKSIFGSSLDTLLPLRNSRIYLLRTELTTS